MMMNDSASGNGILDLLITIRANQTQIIIPYLEAIQAEIDLIKTTLNVANESDSGIERDGEQS